MNRRTFISTLALGTWASLARAQGQAPRLPPKLEIFRLRAEYDNSYLLRSAAGIGSVVLINPRSDGAWLEQACRDYGVTHLVVLHPDSDEAGGICSCPNHVTLLTTQSVRDELHARCVHMPTSWGDLDSTQLDLPGRLFTQPDHAWHSRATPMLAWDGNDGLRAVFSQDVLYQSTLSDDWIRDRETYAAFFSAGESLNVVNAEAASETVNWLARYGGHVFPMHGRPIAASVIRGLRGPDHPWNVSSGCSHD